MGECFRGGDRNVRQFYLMLIKTARDIPTTNRADSNGERIIVQLCLKVLPAGTLSLKSPCQLPVDVLCVSMAAGHLNRFDMPVHKDRYVCLYCNVHMSCILYFFLACFFSFFFSFFFFFLAC